MKIDRMSATIRFSRDIGGSWKSLEVGAEGSINPDEDWTEAQAKRYEELGLQLVKFWNTRPTSQADRQPQEKPDETTPKGEPSTPPHWYAQHQQQFQRFQRGSSTWYAHRLQDGKWCREGGRQRK